MHLGCGTRPLRLSIDDEPSSAWPPGYTYVKGRPLGDGHYDIPEKVPGLTALLLAGQFLAGPLYLEVVFGAFRVVQCDGCPFWCIAGCSGQPSRSVLQSFL